MVTAMLVKMTRGFKELKIQRLNLTCGSEPARD